MKFITFIFTAFISINCLAQIEIVPIYRDPAPIKQSKNKSARTASLPAMSLPFWDDFSATNSKSEDKIYPLRTFWEKGSSTVWVNSGTGINPPSLNVATFDGYDSLGKPYSINNLLAKGFADSLTSRALKLGDVPATLRSSVYISFFYQISGNGESPEPGDILSLLFKDNTNKWKQVWQIENNGSLKEDEFVQVTLPITGAEYFHNDFQFRFQNFGRLSGPYDTWNIDYVYLNSGRNAEDKSFPDRTITTPLTSLFKQYFSIPLKHFKKDSLFAKPSFNTYNLRIGNNQPLNHFSVANTMSYKAKTKINSTKALLDSALSDGSLIGGQSGTFSLIKLPRISSFDTNADSISIQLGVRLSTKDNQLISNNGDFDPATYSPIKFTANDTLTQVYALASYYAYDDGTAEYGAKITGNGTQLAYQFDLVKADTATISAVDIYLPRFGDESSQTFQLLIMSALSNNESDYLLRQTITIQRSALNKFWRIQINPGIVVKDKFYVGWKLNSTAVIAVGLDRNTNSGDKMFVNATGTWEKNTSLKGSLMIRPVFGKAGVISGIEDDPVVKPYPNPTGGSFFLPATAEQIWLYDLSGKEVMFDQNDQVDKKQITITNPSVGLYLVRYFDQKWRTEKIMVLP
ncbi:MAG: T9SS type A sorting domain-containing protein [Cyclobacteriaceae bacterium]